MRTDFINHACVRMRAAGVDLLCDPWFGGEVFNRAWRLVSPGPDDLTSFTTVTHVWISHEHPDHLNFPTLKRLFQVCPDAVVLYRRQANQNVVLALREIGFATRELDAEVAAEIVPGFSVQTFERGGDAALLVRAGGHAVFNQNDCHLTRRQLRAVRMATEGLDLTHLFQFSLAGYYANADDERRLRKAAALHVRWIKGYVHALRPRRFVPFASFVYFCKPENRYLNTFHVDLNRVTDALGAELVQVVRPGDEVLGENHQARSAANRAWWREAFTAADKAAPSHIAATEDLDAIAHQFLQSQTMPRLLRPGPVVVALSQSGAYVTIDCARGTFARSSTAPRRAAVTLPDDEFAFFLKHPWGADTLNVTGTARIHRHLRFRRLAYYRHGEYVLGRFSAPVRYAVTTALAAIRTLQHYVN